jgi:hypothetical protein
LNQQNAENRNLHLHAASVRTDRIYYLQFCLKKEEDVVESFTRFQATLGMAIGMIPRMEARRVLRRRWRFQDPGKMNPPISHSRYESMMVHHCGHRDDWKEKERVQYVRLGEGAGGDGMGSRLSPHASRPHNFQFFIY